MNSAALGKSDHQSVLPRGPSTTAAKTTTTVMGPKRDGADAVIAAIAKPAAAAAVQDGVPLMPGLPSTRAGRRVKGTRVAWARPIAEPEARISASISNGIRT